MTLRMCIDALDLPKELDDRFEELAQIKGAPKNSLILTALEEWIEDQEDAALADEILAKVRTGTVKILSSEEVGRHLGLDN